MEPKKEIQEFLTSRRAAITPEQAGLPTYGARRVPGLRREEVAVLAGVSVPYYTRLERGDLSGVSDGVLEALAGALRLDDAERAHLFDLARAAQPTGARPTSTLAQTADPARDPVDARRDHRRRRIRGQRPPRHPRHQLARTRAVLRAVRRTDPAGELRPLRVPRPARRDASTPTGTAPPATPPRSCARPPAATRTTVTSQTSSASSRPEATRSAPTGRPTTSASTPPPSSTSTTPSSASSASASTAWTSPPTTASRSSPTPPNPAPAPRKRSTCSEAGRPPSTSPTQRRRPTRAEPAAKIPEPSRRRPALALVLCCEGAPVGLSVEPQSLVAREAIAR